ncbi:MAG: lipopolysaccharide biosynthesis protein [Actinomycetales bacterium]
MTSTTTVAKSRFARDTVISTLSALVLPATALITGPLLARVLHPEGRGLMAMLLAPIFLASFVAATAVPDGVIFAIARRGLSHARAMRAGGLLAVCCGALAAALIWALAPWLMRQAPEHTQTLRWLGLSLPLLTLAIVQRSALLGSRWYRLANLERITAALVRLGLLVGTAIGGVLTATTAALSNILANISALALLLGLSARRLRRQRRQDAAPPPALGSTSATTAPPGQDAPHPATHDPATNTTDPARQQDAYHLRPIRSIAFFGLRGWPGVLSNLVNFRLDQAMLALMVDPRLLGFYVVAVTFSELPGVATAVLKQMVFAESSSRDDVWLVARAARTVGLIVAILAVLGCALAEPLIHLLFGERFLPAVGLSRVLLIATVPLALDQLIGSGLLTLGRPGLRAIAQSLAALVTVAGLLTLVPMIGVMGAALTSLVAYTTTMLVTALMLCRLSELRLTDLFLPRVADLRALTRILASIRSRRGKKTTREGISR